MTNRTKITVVRARRFLADCAIAWDHRPEAGENPCTGIVRYRRPPRGRLLGADDLAKLGAGAADSTSPRRLPGEWVFPGGKGNGPLTESELYWFWRKTREAAGIVADAQLHDLCHAHASHAVMNGESLHVAGRLLRHRRASTTNRYVHFDDATLSEAAELKTADKFLSFDEYEKIASQNRTWRMRGVICMSLADLHRYITFSLDAPSSPGLTRQRMEAVYAKIRATAIPMTAESHARHVEFVRSVKEGAPR